MENKDANTLSNIYKIEDDTCLILFDDTDNQGYKMPVFDFRDYMNGSTASGNLDDLTTIAKTTLVDAINELHVYHNINSNLIMNLDTDDIHNITDFSPDNGRTYWWRGTDTLDQALKTVATYAYTAYNATKNGGAGSTVRNVGKLSFSGASTAVYDGSTDINVNIPSAGKTTGRLLFTGGSTEVFDGSKDVVINLPTGSGGTSENRGKLTFTGGFTGTYDGTSDVSVIIPGGSGGTGSTLTGVINASDLPNNGTDCTAKLQGYIDSLWSAGGGTIYLPAGTFGIKSLNMHSKVSLIGAGIGVTCLKHIGKSTHNNAILYFPKGSGACRISDLYIDGNYETMQDDARGIYVESLENDYSGMYPGLGTIVSQYYGFQNKISDNSVNTYKYLYIDHVTVAYCGGWGVYVGRVNYSTDMSYCNVYACNNGIYYGCMDSYLSDVTIEYCAYKALESAGGNNKFFNLKVMWNGRLNTTKYAATFTNSGRSMITNMEFQDNWCSDLYLGSNNIIATGLLLDAAKHRNNENEDMLYITGTGCIIHATFSNYAGDKAKKKKNALRIGKIDGCKIVCTITNGCAENNYNIPSVYSGQVEAILTSG